MMSTRIQQETVESLTRVCGPCRRNHERFPSGGALALADNTRSTTRTTEIGILTSFHHLRFPTCSEGKLQKDTARACAENQRLAR